MAKPTKRKPWNLWGERASVFSRALLKTGWLPAGGTGKIPQEFTKRMEESQPELDLDIAMLLPQFELEPPKLLIGKEYYGMLEDRRLRSFHFSGMRITQLLVRRGSQEAAK